MKLNFNEINKFFFFLKKNEKFPPKKEKNQVCRNSYFCWNCFQTLKLIQLGFWRGEVLLVDGKVWVFFLGGLVGWLKGMFCSSCVATKFIVCVDRLTRV